MKNVIILCTDYRFFRLFYLSNLRLLEDVNIIVMANNNYSEKIDGGLSFIKMATQRKISILSDVGTVMSIFLKCWRIKPDLIISIMPKTGLINAVISRFSRFKTLHIFTGQVWAKELTTLDKILKKIDYFIVRSVDYLYADGASQIQFLEAQGVAESSMIKLVCNGSIAGVDRARFVPADGRESESVRFLFLGRLCKDKGLDEIICALELLQSASVPKFEMLLCGQDEEGYVEKLNKFENVTVANFTLSPETEMKKSDVLILPSYREGFGSVVAEAQFCGLWSIVSDTYGLRGVVTDEVNGYVVRQGCGESVYFAMKNAISNIDDIRNRKVAISNVASSMYDQRQVQEFWKNELGRILYG